MSVSYTLTVSKDVVAVIAIVLLFALAAFLICRTK